MSECKWNMSSAFREVLGNPKKVSCLSAFGSKAKGYNEMNRRYCFLREQQKKIN